MKSTMVQGAAVERVTALARSGAVEAEEALAKAVDKADLARRLGRSAG